MILLFNLVLQNQFQLPKDGDYMAHASRVFHRNSRKVFSDAMSYARGMMLEKGSEVYLKENEYRQVTFVTTICLQLLIIQVVCKL